MQDASNMSLNSSKCYTVQAQSDGLSSAAKNKAEINSGLIFRQVTSKTLKTVFIAFLVH